MHCIGRAPSGSEIDGFAADQAAAADETKIGWRVLGGMRQSVNEKSAARLGSAGRFAAARPAAPGTPVFERLIRTKAKSFMG